MSTPKQWHREVGEEWCLKYTEPFYGDTEALAQLIADHEPPAPTDQELVEKWASEFWTVNGGDYQKIKELFTLFASEIGAAGGGK